MSKYTDSNNISLWKHTNKTVFACVVGVSGVKVWGRTGWFTVKDYIRDYLKPSYMGQRQSFIEHTKTQETFFFTLASQKYVLTGSVPHILSFMKWLIVSVWVVLSNINKLHYNYIMLSFITIMFYVHRMSAFHPKSEIGLVHSLWLTSCQIVKLKLGGHSSAVCICFQQSSFFLLISFSAGLPSPSPAAPLCCREEGMERKEIAQCRACCSVYKKSFRTMWCDSIPARVTTSGSVSFRSFSSRVANKRCFISYSPDVCFIWSTCQQWTRLSEHQLSSFPLIFHLSYLLLSFFFVSCMRACGTIASSQEAGWDARQWDVLP